ncbi:MAG: hypothetical protein AB7V56_12530 [Candidatus Nitrosocosmicus sp.]
MLSYPSIVTAQESGVNVEDTTLNLDTDTFSFYQKVGLAFVIAFVVILSITLGVNNWFKNKYYSKRIKNNFWYIIRDSDCYPSLALFQFTLWTFTISFSYLGIYLSRVLNGVPALGQLDTNILILLGLSISVPIISKSISNIKYFLPCPDPLPAYSTMLEENGKLSLTRFQYFLWTWVSLVIFFTTLAYDITQLTPDKINDFSLPVIHETLLVLMGISQVGYLGTKVITRSPTSITKLLSSYNPNHKRNVWTILGNGFGDNPEKVIVTISTQTDVDIIEYTDNSIADWSDKRISLYPNLYKLTEPSKADSHFNPGDKLKVEILVDSKITASEFKFDDGIFMKETI